MGRRPEVVYGNDEVVREAFERKDGGAIPERKDGGSIPRTAKGRFKKGGAVKPELNTGGEVKEKVVFKEGGKVEGRKSGGRLDKFARGGKVGCDKNPYSSAKLD